VLVSIKTKLTVQVSVLLHQYINLLKKKKKKLSPNINSMIFYNIVFQYCDNKKKASQNIIVAILMYNIGPIKMSLG